MPQKISLRVLLAVQFAAQVVGIVGLVGYLSYSSGQQAVRGLATQLTNSTAERVHDRLNDFLTNAQTVLALNHRALEGQSLMPENFQQAKEHFIETSELYDEFTSMGFGYANGESVAAGWDKYGIFTAAGTRVFGETIYSRSTAHQVYRLNEQGEPVELLKTIPGYDPRQIIWYETAITSGEQTWSPIFPFALASFACILAVDPHYDNDQLQGVAFVTILLDDISRFLNTVDFSPNGQVFIVERSGDLVATSSLEQAYVATGTVDHRQLTRVNAARSQDALTQATMAALVQQGEALDTLEQLTFQFTNELPVADNADNPRSDLQGRQHYFANVSPYQDDYGLDWLIVTVVPESDFMGAIHANVRRTAWICGLALIGAIGSGLWTSRRITRSLLRLTRATQDFSQGKPIQPLEPTRIQEVTTLSEAFQQMVEARRQAVQLQQNYKQDLEQQVTEKTAALQKSTAQLQAAQRIAQVGSWELDISTQKVTWSDELFRIAGRHPEHAALDASDILEIVHPEDREDLHQAVETAIADGTPYEVEHRITWPDGTIRHVVSRGEAFYSDQDRDQNQVIKLAGTTADISNRKQIEALLQESKQRYEALAETAPVGIFLHDAEDTCIYVNDRYCQITGLTSEAAKGQGWQQGLHPDDRERIIAEWERSVHEKYSFQLEYRYQHPDGTVKWVYTQSAVEKNVDGQVIGYVGIITDITELKQAEAAMRRYEGIVSATPDGISLVDSNYIYRIVNQTYLDRTGQVYEEIVDHSVSDLLGEAVFISQVKPQLDRCLAGEVVQYEDWFDYSN
ncbi:MAG: PAS domain S-box protein [Leptolyngbya sp. SIO1D8]|nr:PAS domain S-box protein [Leptolyngbya sp. SIO1D8]